MMIRNISFIILISWLIAIPIAKCADFEKIKIAVLDFQLQGEGFETKEMGKIVAEWLITALVQEGRFDVIERRLLEQIINEQKLVMTGIVNKESATQLGKLLGVKVIISGSVMRFQDIIEVNARIIDVENASIITAESVKSKTATRLEELIGQMAEKIIKDFPLAGYIVNRKSSSVMIDLGRKAGVKEGMRFMVYKEGKIIKHPKTGAVLTVEKIQTGVVEIVSVSKKISQAKIVSETMLSAISYGQLVAEQPYEKDKPTDLGLLYVNTDPPGALIKVLNIREKYRRGMELKKGNYHIQASANGYENRNEWVYIEPGKDNDIRLRLSIIPQKKEIIPQVKPEPEPEPPATTKVPTYKPTGETEKYAHMLQSNNSKDIILAAKKITRSHATDQRLLSIVETVLRKGNEINQRDKYHLSAMAWLCNVLGASGRAEYKPLLLSISKNRRTGGYLRKYAEKNYRILVKKTGR